MIEAPRIAPATSAKKELGKRVSVNHKVSRLQPYGSRRERARFDLELRSSVHPFVGLAQCKHGSRQKDRETSRTTLPSDRIGVKN